MDVVLTGVNNVTDGPNELPVVDSTIPVDSHGHTIARSDTGSHSPFDPAIPSFRLLHVAPEGHLTLNEATLQNGWADDGLSETSFYYDRGGLLNRGRHTQPQHYLG